MKIPGEPVFEEASKRHSPIGVFSKRFDEIPMGGMVSVASPRGHVEILKRYRSPMRVASVGVSLCTLGFLGLACAPHQWVPVDVEPPSATVYLDGEALEDLPEELKLRSDRDHTFLVKSPGHRGELVVLRSVEQDGDSVLEPEGVQVRLVPTAARGRELIIEPVPES